MTMKNKSTKRLLASIVLSFQSIVIFFATLTAFGLKMAEPTSNLPAIELIWGIGLSFALLAILTPAFLRNPAGYWLGWLVQAAPRSSAPDTIAVAKLVPDTARRPPGTAAFIATPQAATSISGPREA